MLFLLIMKNMMIEILFLFMIYSLIGWIWETPYVSFNQKKYVNRGFLKGPYIPIYGYVCLTIILSMSVFDNMEESFFLIIVQIIFISLVSAVWEYFTSLGLETAFKTRWWDYSTHKFNLNGRICLDYTILFGIGGFLLWYFLNPVFVSLYDTISPNYVFGIIVVFYTIFIVDNVYTFRDLIRLRTIIIRLNKLMISFSGKYDHVFEKAYNSITERDERFSKALSEYKSSLKKELSIIRKKGGNKLALSLENRADDFNSILLKSKNLTRFFNKYPKAPSKSFSYLLKVLKYEKHKKDNDQKS